MTTLDSMLALLVADDPRRSADRTLTRLVQIHQARGGAILRPREDQAEIWLSAGLSMAAGAELPVSWADHCDALAAGLTIKALKRRFWVTINCWRIPGSGIPAAEAGKQCPASAGSKAQSSINPLSMGDTHQIVLPTVDGSPASGSVISVDSLDSNIRGQVHTTIGGKMIRPDLVLVDDPQTRESAKSADQTTQRLATLNGDVLGLAGPGKKISGLLTCTKIYAEDLADQILDPKKNPEWQGECTKMLYAMPTSEKLWDDYARIRADSLRAGHGSVNRG